MAVLCITVKYLQKKNILFVAEIHGHPIQNVEAYTVTSFGIFNVYCEKSLKALSFDFSNENMGRDDRSF
jgi:hypothetical protein